MKKWFILLFLRFPFFVSSLGSSSTSAPFSHRQLPTHVPPLLRSSPGRRLLVLFSYQQRSVPGSFTLGVSLEHNLFVPQLFILSLSASPRFFPHCNSGFTLLPFHLIRLLLFFIADSFRWSSFLSSESPSCTHPLNFKRLIPRRSSIFLFPSGYAKQPRK